MQGVNEFPGWSSHCLSLSSVFRVNLSYSSLKKKKYFAFKGALCGDHYEWMDDPAGRQTYDDVSSSNFFLCGKFVRKDIIFMIPSAIQASKFLFGFGYCSPFLTCVCNWTIRRISRPYRQILPAPFEPNWSSLHVLQCTDYLLSGQLIEKITAKP